MPTKKSRSLSAGGWLREWLVLGTFPGRPSELLLASIIVEPAMHPSTGDRAKGRTWHVHSAAAPYIDLLGSPALAGPRNDCAAYAHVYLRSDRPQKAELVFGSDDGCAIWLNGRRVFCREAMRPCVPDDDSVMVDLALGYNRLLVKVEQYGGGWGFAMRVASPGGAPAEGVAYELDDPLGKGWKADPAPVLPCAVSIRPPSAAMSPDASPDAELGFSVSVANVSGKRLGPGTIEITSASGAAIASAAFAYLPPYGGSGTSFTISTRAWIDGVSVEARQGKRRVSPSAPCKADGLRAFVITSRGARVTGVDPGVLERVRRDLSAGEGAIGDDADLARAVEILAGSPTDASSILRVDALLSERAKQARTQSVFLVGHAHIDMNWLWRWPETVQCCRDSFRQALSFMDEFPDFRFSQSQASVYEAMEREDPALFERIKKAIAQGRWEVTGGMWTEGDTNISSGEALCRSFMLAQRYFREKFGITAKTGWLPDNFGHAAQLPQLLRLAGLDSFYHMRCGPSLGELYRWRGPDGSTVLAKTGQGYNDQVTPDIRHQPARVPESIGSQMFVYGVGDHGGGPTRRDITATHALAENRLFPELRLATTRDYFAHVAVPAARLPVHDGELQFTFEGCYTNVARVKQGNRRLENALQAAEGLAVTASHAGLPYPSAELESAWKTLVFNEFHDILPGSAIHESNLDSTAKYHQALETVRLVRDRCLRYIGERVHIEENARIPLVVFNPLAHERGDIVVAELVTTEPLSSVRVTDESGAETAAQIVRTRRFDAYDHLWVQFRAPAVPGLGHRVFFVETARQGPALPITGWANPYTPMIPLSEAGPGISVDKNRVRNRFFDLRFDDKTGTVTSLAWKAGRAKKELAGKRGFNRLAMFLERPHEMSAWNLDAGARGPVDLEVTSPAEIVQAGPESVSWAASFAYGKSTFRLTTTVHADSPRIDCHLAAEWVERGTPRTDAPMLRVLSSLASKPKALVCDTPFYAALREAGREVPAQKWVDVAIADNVGLALMNRGKYGHSLRDGVLGLTLLRSAYDPDLLPDVGRHEIEWAILPHAGTWKEAGVPLAALSYNVPFETFQARAQKGPLGLSKSLLSFDAPDRFLVTGVKRAEDGHGIVVRGYDVTGEGCSVSATGELAEGTAERLDIVEDEVPGEPVRLGEVKAKPYEIVTLRIA
jgi:alpha-mannosidase